VAREIVEASVFWAGDLFAVRYFAVGEPVFFDDVPKTASVEVRTRVVDAAQKMPRNRWDLPLGAIAITAAFLNAMVVGSFARDDVPAFDRYIDVAPASHDTLVIAETPPVADAAVGLGIVPVVLTEEDERAGDEPKIVDVLGDTGMLAMLSRYRGGEEAPSVPWAPAIENGTMRGTAIDEAWGVGGLALSGVSEGGGGGKGTGVVLDRVHTEVTGSGHGHLVAHQVGPICHLPIVTAISCNRMPPEIIQRIVRSNLSRFRACYAEGLKNDPALTGRVVTKFVIARDGSVAATSDGGSDLPDEGVRACVHRAFMNLSFPEVPGGSIATVTYPIVMSPAD